MLISLILLYHNFLLQNAQCGANFAKSEDSRVDHQRVKRIIDEERCKFGRYPYVVAVLRNVQYTYKNDKMIVGQNRTCTGTLLNSKTVVTAAACTIKVHLVAGTWDETLPVSTIETVVRHPGYVVGDLYDNIAIIQLTNEIYCPRFPLLRPIKDESIDIRCEYGLVLGYGIYMKTGQREGELHPLTSKLPCAQLTVLTKSETTQIFFPMASLGLPVKLGENLFAAFDPENHIKLTLGDGGAPFICNQDLLGILSWQISYEKSSTKPSKVYHGESDEKETYIFTRLDRYLDFIDEYVL